LHDIGLRPDDDPGTFEQFGAVFTEFMEQNPDLLIWAYSVISDEIYEQA